MYVNGFVDAFVVAYKGGKKVSWHAAGATMSTDYNGKPVQEKESVKFKVQIGAFKSNVPANLLEKYIEIPEVGQITSGGVTMFTVGSFSNYNSAVKHKNKMKDKYGIKDAFVISFKGDKLIDVKDAIELSK